MQIAFSVLDVTRTTVVWDTRHEDRIARTSLFGIGYQHTAGLKGVKAGLYWTLVKKYETHHLLGLETEWRSLALRLGRNASGLTAGAGIAFWKFRVDYALVALDFENAHRVSCAFTF
jgi:hypothetical protein